MSFSIPQSPRDLELDRVQRWFQSVITHPNGVSAGLVSSEAVNQINVEPGELEQVVCRSQSQTAIERLGIYANAYYGRLLECLREEFPALKKAVGDAAFDALAFSYLQAHPSRSYTLSALSANFPQFLAETRPTKDAGHGDEPDWPQFLIELAQLERLYSEVFDGPGMERERPLTSDDLLESLPSVGLGLRLVPVPSLRFVEFQYPVHDYATAVRHQASADDVAIPDPAPTYLVITRRDYIVRRVPMSRVQYELLKSLADGTPLGEAIARSAERIDADLEEVATNLQTWFQEWTAAPFFARVHLSD